ncbi:unnamed protein product, partial [Amoebophrya sp. A25]
VARIFCARRFVPGDDLSLRRVVQICRQQAGCLIPEEDEDVFAHDLLEATLADFLINGVGDSVNPLEELLQSLVVVGKKDEDRTSGSESSQQHSVWFSSTGDALLDIAKETEKTVFFGRRNHKSSSGGRSASKKGSTSAIRGGAATRGQEEELYNDEDGPSFAALQ